MKEMWVSIPTVSIECILMSFCIVYVVLFLTSPVELNGKFEISSKDWRVYFCHQHFFLLQ